MSELIPSTSSPLPERSLNRQVILEEDEYTEALSRIIARDFFPSLVHLDATNEYLDALRTRDPHLINASVRRLEDLNFTPAVSERRRRMVQTPSQTPFGLASETPIQTPYGEPPQKRTKYDADMSLDEFQARYTSEDNSSFTKILDEENRVRKEKWEWAWDAQRRVENGRTKMIERREMMLIEPPAGTGVREKFVIEAPQPPAGLIKGAEDDENGTQDTSTGDDTKRKSVVRVPQKASEDEPPVDVMAPKKDTREAGVDGWKFRARNSLMFTPDADVSPYHELPKPSTTENDSRGVNYSSTRLAEFEHNSGDSRSVSAPPSPTRSRIDAAITGTPYHPRSPKERGLGLVPNLPSPTPAELGPAAMKQLMTWGTLNSTPRIISQTDDSSTPFHMPDISAREAMSRKLSDNASKSLRVKAEMFGPAIRGSRTAAKTPLLGKKGSMAPPTSTPRRAEAAGSLTPAARRLLHRSTLGTAASRRAEAMERSAGWDLGAKGERDLDRVRWTPTPSPVTRR